MFNCDARVKLSGAFHFIEISEISFGNINGTHVYPAFHWKIPEIPGNNWNFEKLAFFSLETYPIKSAFQLQVFTSCHKALSGPPF